jgi:putative peptidoglycan lipid II flippase
VGSYLTQSSISALKYSATVIGIPQAMFVGNLAVAIFPTLSLAAAKNEMGGFRRSLVRGLSALWFIVLPSTAGLVFLGQPIISAVYQHGAFTAEATALTVSALLFYALGLFAFAGNALLGNAFVALGDTLTPTMLGLVSVGLNVNLNLILAGPMGAGGLALATSISASVSFLALLYFLRRRIGAGTFRGIWQPVAKMVLASALMGGACLLLWWLLEWWVPASGYWWRLSEAVVVALVGVVLYAGLSRWFRIEELDRYLGYARRFWRKMQDLRRSSRPE